MLWGSLEPWFASTTSAPAAQLPAPAPPTAPPAGGDGGDGGSGGAGGSSVSERAGSCGTASGLSSSAAANARIPEQVTAVFRFVALCSSNRMSLMS